MLRAELTVDFREFKSSIHLNALFNCFRIVDEAYFEHGHQVVSQMNVALEEPNLIKCPVFQHAANERFDNEMKCKIKSNSINKTGRLFEFFLREKFEFSKYRYTYWHLFNIKILMSGITGKNAPISRSSQRRSISASICSLKLKNA